MDGMHDLGGRRGYGRVPLEQEEVFGHDWQKRAFALTEALAAPVPFSTDEHRFAIERLGERLGGHLGEPLAQGITSPETGGPKADGPKAGGPEVRAPEAGPDYFGKWFMATEMLLLEAGLVSAEELRSGRPDFTVNTEAHQPVSPAELVTATRNGARMRFDPGARRPAFRIGETVRVQAASTPGHTRLPRYVRGHPGRIVEIPGLFQFADAVAAGTGPDPHFCYTLAFEAQALWGAEAAMNDIVMLDLWEPYLEPF